MAISPHVHVSSRGLPVCIASCWLSRKPCFGTLWGEDLIDGPAVVILGLGYQADCQSDMQKRQESVPALQPIGGLCNLRSVDPDDTDHEVLPSVKDS